MVNIIPGQNFEEPMNVVKREAGLIRHFSASGSDCDGCGLGKGKDARLRLVDGAIWE